MDARTIALVYARNAPLKLASNVCLPRWAPADVCRARLGDQCATAHAWRRRSAFRPARVTLQIGARVCKPLHRLVRHVPLLDTACCALARTTGGTSTRFVERSSHSDECTSDAAHWCNCIGRPRAMQNQSSLQIYINTRLRLPVLSAACNAHCLDVTRARFQNA